MECFCGCGTKVPRRLIDANMQLGKTALDLLAWDKQRATGRLDPLEAVEIDRLIERGAACHRRLLLVVHGEREQPSYDDSEQWLNESEGRWRRRAEMIERGSFLKGPRLRLTDDDIEQLDRQHPERSFSAGGPTAAEDDGGGARQLGRLEALRAEGVLTEEEFDAARARLLGRD